MGLCSSSRALTVRYVRSTPSLRTLSMTCLTWSGRLRALASRLF